MKTLKLFASLCVLLALPGVARAAGFALDVQSARATGMASAVTAISDDPSATFFNPAGLVGSKGFQMALGGALIVPSLEVTTPSGYSAQTQGYSPPPHLHARYQLMDDVAAGVGVFVPFGASTSWNWTDDAAGQLGKDRTLGSNLSVYVINPEIAFKFDRLKLGVGVQVARATVLLKRGLNFVDSSGGVELGGATWGTGFNAGVQVQLVPDMLDLGVSWRSGINLDVVGQAHFSGAPAEFQSRLVDQGVQTSVDLPTVVNAGIGFKPMKDLQLALDVHYTDWSSFRSLDLNLDNPELSSSLPKNWHDTFSFHLGGEYRVTRSFTARAGLAYDPMPSPEETLTPDLPDSNRMKAALGLGYGVSNFNVDLGYQFVLLSDVTSTSPLYLADYSGTAQVLGLTLGWTSPL